MKTCAILILSTHERRHFFERLEHELKNQINDLKAHAQFNIYTFIDDGSKTIGFKRNDLIKQAVANGVDYVEFFDDDDLPGDKHIETIKAGIDSGADVVSLRGAYYVDGKLDGIFEHSLKYDQWKTNDVRFTDARGEFIKYERYPNHLNCMKLFIAKQFPFPETNHGEDKFFSDQVFKSGLLKKEYYSDEIIYQYLYRSQK